MRLLMANLASPSNPGDAAIYLGSLKLIRECFPDSEIVLATRAYSEREAYAFPDCRVIPGYPNVEAFGGKGFLGKLAVLPRVLSAKQPLRSEIRKADAVFLAGGGYLYSYRRWTSGLTFLSHHVPAFWAAAAKKPVFFLPQSYGPLVSRAAQNLLRKSMKTAKRVYYRDLCSGQWLQKNYGELAGKMAYMPDHAFYANPEALGAGAPGAAERSWIAATIRPWEHGARSEEIPLRMKRLLVRLHRETGAGIHVVSQVIRPRSVETDEAISRSLAASLTAELGEEHVRLHLPEGRFEAGALSRLYAGCRLVIGMRLHSAILAMISGSPAVAVGYQPKAEGVLSALGMKELYLGGAEDFSEDRAFSLCCDILKQNELWRGRIKDAVGQARQQIRNTFMEDVVGSLK